MSLGDMVDPFSSIDEVIYEDDEIVVTRIYSNNSHQVLNPRERRRALEAMTRSHETYANTIKLCSKFGRKAPGEQSCSSMRELLDTVNIACGKNVNYLKKEGVDQ
ncbi:unnamed protein product [Timema podura]|uniref:Uncharacterized protein n=1 Tax=Timema podura TaxID=61482 RepID=A0ABN7P527_TIMPD|nr:unnamed protein product [Timema podura]